MLITRSCQPFFATESPQTDKARFVLEAHRSRVKKMRWNKRIPEGATIALMAHGTSPKSTDSIFRTGTHPSTTNPQVKTDLLIQIQITRILYFTRILLSPHEASPSSPFLTRVLIFVGFVAVAKQAKVKDGLEKEFIFQVMLFILFITLRGSVWFLLGFFQDKSIQSLTDLNLMENPFKIDM